MAVYVTSDLHGIPLEQLRGLLAQADFSQEDYLFILGDVIDRGDHGVEILKWLLDQTNVQLLLGNHEAMLLSCKFLFQEVTDDSLAALTKEKFYLLANWRSNGAEPTIKALRQLLQEAPETLQYILEYLEDAPLYERLRVGSREFLLCHAGFENFDKNKPLSGYSQEEWLWSRPAPEAEFFKDIRTVFGHTPTVYYGPEYRGKILRTATWIDVDTSPDPCLLRLDDLKSFYFPGGR